MESTPDSLEVLIAKRDDDRKSSDRNENDSFSGVGLGMKSDGNDDSAAYSVENRSLFTVCLLVALFSEDRKSSDRNENDSFSGVGLGMKSVSSSIPMLGDGKDNSTACSGEKRSLFTGRLLVALFSDDDRNDGNVSGVGLGMKSVSSSSACALGPIVGKDNTVACSGEKRSLFTGRLFVSLFFEDRNDGNDSGVGLGMKSVSSSSCAVAVGPMVGDRKDNSTACSGEIWTDRLKR